MFKKGEGKMSVTDIAGVDVPEIIGIKIMVTRACNGVHRLKINTKKSMIRLRNKITKRLHAQKAKAVMVVAILLIRICKQYVSVKMCQARNCPWFNSE
jgi:hypothetical protein